MCVVEFRKGLSALCLLFLVWFFRAGNNTDQWGGISPCACSVTLENKGQIKIPQQDLHRAGTVIYIHTRTQQVTYKGKIVTWVKNRAWWEVGSSFHRRKQLLWIWHLWYKPGTDLWLEREPRWAQACNDSASRGVGVLPCPSSQYQHYRRFYGMTFVNWVRYLKQCFILN